MPTATRARTHERAADHLLALDGLRGFAILAVVAFHVAVLATESAPWAYRHAPPIRLWPAFAGSLGVDVFFVLSGLLVFQSWQNIRRRRDGDPVGATADFARRRARRILPPYLFALAVLIPWRTPDWLSSAEGWVNIGMFSTLNHFLDPALPHKLNTVTWSLTTETHFYVALPVMAFVGARFGWTKMLAVLVLTTVTWRIAAGGTGGNAEWIIGRADQFAAGMMAATLYADHRAGRSSALGRWLTGRWAGWVLGAGLVALAAAHGGARLVPKPLAFLVVLHPVAGLAIASLVVRGLCREGLRVFRNRFLRWAGAISYSLYLWHWPLLAESTHRWGPGAHVLALALVASLVVACGSYLVLERPFVRPRETPQLLPVRRSDPASVPA